MVNSGHVRSIGRLARGGGVGGIGLLLTCVSVVALPLSLVGVGLPVLTGATWLVRRVANAERRRLHLPTPYRPLPAAVGARIRVVATDPATWRDLVWLPAQFVAGLFGIVMGVGVWLAAVECLTAPLFWLFLPRDAPVGPAVVEWVGRSVPAGLVLVGVGAALTALAFRLPRLLLVVQDRLAASLLAPTAAARLAARVDHLATTRSTALDSSAADLRRIERDLHDGAQARLVALSMNLGLAAEVVEADPAAAKALLTEARATASASLSELRSLVRGIHPPLLADRGLASAIEALALDAPVPVEVESWLERRLPAAVESTAYFATAEALTNAIRHSGASHIRIAVTDENTRLRIVVSDNGQGGADPAAGTGLHGIHRRLSTLDGSLRIESPTGGPTVLTMELACES